MLGKTISHYKILEKIGEGGMGIVYRAHDTRLDRDVALKFLPRYVASNDEERERFIVEAKAAARLGHANIATIHAIEEHDDQMFIVMEFIEGSELSGFIPGKGNDLSTESSQDYAEQIAKGLSAAHESGIIHRDVKPANIMITPKSEVKLMDFGLAKMSAASARITKEHSTLGTVAYMSPEQASGESVDHRSDIWSFGVVLYELFTGSLPFRGEYEQVVIFSIVNDEPVPLSESGRDVPKHIQEVINRCLQKDTEDRFQSMAEVLAALGGRDHMAAGLSAARPAPWTRARQLAVGATLLAVAGLIAVATYFAGNDAPKITERTPIAVVDIVNESDERALDGLSGMLITSLEQSRRLSVMTRSRMIDVKRQLGRADAPGIDEALGREICRREKIGAMAIATIRKFDQLYTIDLNVIDPINDAFLFSTRQRAEGQSEIPDMIDALAMQVRSELDESQFEIAQRNRSIAQTTTPNLEAYYHYFKSQDAIAMAEFARGESELLRALELDSTFGLAWLRLSNVKRWKNGGEGNARIPLEKAIQYKNQMPEKERMLLTALEARLNHGKGSERDILLEAESIYPQDKELLYILGDNFFHSGMLEQARPYFQKIVMQDSLHADAIRHLVWITSRLDGLDAGEAIVREGLRLNPNSFSLRACLAEFFYLKKDYAAAESELRRIFEAEPNFDAVAQGLYLNMEKLGKSTEIEILLRDALSSTPGSPDIRATLGRLLENQQRGAEAEQLYLEALAGPDSNSYSIVVSFGRYLLNQQRYAEAERVLRRSPDFINADTEIDLMLGQALTGQQKHEEALLVYRRYLDGSPGGVNALAGLTSSLIALEREDELHEVVDSIIINFSDHEARLQNAGWAMFRARQWKVSEKLFNAAIRANPENTNSYAGLGWALYRQDRLQPAKKAFAHGVDSISADPAGLNGLGIVAVAEGDYQAALTYYERLDSLSSNAWTKSQLGHISLAMNETQSARRHFEAALEQSPAYTYALKGLASLNILIEDYEQAMSFAMRAVTADSSFDSYSLLAHIFVVSENDIEKGIGYANTAISKKPAPGQTLTKVYPHVPVPKHTLGLAFLHKGEYEKAVSVLEEALEQFPTRQNIQGDLRRAKSLLD